MNARRVAAPLAVCLAVAAGAAADLVGALPEPGERGSHERYLEALRSEEARVAAELLARYERRIAEAPDDVVAAVERCRFLGAAFYDPELEENPREAERAACVEEVEARFAAHPDARVFAVEQRWGSEAAEAGDRFLADPPAGSGPQHLTAVHTHLARQLQFEDAERAMHHAEAAMEIDPTADLRLMVGEARSEAGDADGARSVLEERLEQTQLAWELEAKGALLADLEAFEAALAAFAEVERRGETIGRKFDHARALAGLGRIDEARAAYGAGEEPWATVEALQARFDFELEHGTAETARAAYDALLARGWDSDLVGRRRLALLAAHPRAPWKWEDAPGLIALATIGVSIAMLPASFILPIYAIGLLRRRRSRAEPAPAERFGLRHAWLASAVMILAQCVGFLVYPEVIEGDTFPLGRATASYALMSAVAGAAGLLLVTGRATAELVGPGRWRWPRMLVVGVLVTGVFQLTAVGVAWAIGSDAGDPSTTEMMRSVQTSFGVPATFLFAALLVPVAEELLFRGVLLSAFRTRLSPGWANLAQAGLFGALHAHPVVAPAAFALGLAAGRATRVSGSLRTALFAHVLANAIACALLVWLGA
jgi:membrane protease YdiL (CAAX protease family)